MWIVASEKILAQVKNRISNRYMLSVRQVVIFLLRIILPLSQPIWRMIPFHYNSKKKKLKKEKREKSELINLYWIFVCSLSTHCLNSFVEEDSNMNDVTDVENWKRHLWGLTQRYSACAHGTLTSYICLHLCICVEAKNNMYKLWQGFDTIQGIYMYEPNHSINV